MSEFEPLWQVFQTVGGPALLQARLGTHLEAEALVLGAKAGVDPAIIIQVLSGGYAQTRVMDVRGPLAIRGDFEPGFRSRFHYKDLNIIMDTATALANIAKELDKKELKHLESEAWEDFLDMTCGQANLWCATNTEPEKKNSEIMPTEPYLLGSHSGCCGIWASGPEDVGAPTAENHPDKDKIPSHLPEGWNWGYRGMTTVKGLFTAGDGVGASGHKFSSGSHAEGRMCAKSMVKYVMDNQDLKPELDTDVDTLIEEIYRPVRNFLEHKDYSTAIDVNPNYITPRMLQFRLQKIMDEYVAGVATYYRTNAKMMEVAEGKLEMLNDSGDDSKRKDVILAGFVNFGIPLRGEEDLFVRAAEGLFQRDHRRTPADHERRHHVRIHHHVPQRNGGQLNG